MACATCCDSLSTPVLAQTTASATTFDHNRHCVLAAGAIGDGAVLRDHVALPGDIGQGLVPFIRLVRPLATWFVTRSSAYLKENQRFGVG